jgi:hypothetical protein
MMMTPDDLTGRRTLARLARCATLFILGTAGVAAAQAPGKLELGAVYSCEEMNHYAFKVLSCDAKDWCQVFIVNKAAPQGGNVTGEGKATVLSTIGKNKCTIKGRPAEAKAADETRNQRASAPAAGVAAAGCSSDPSVSVKAKAGDSMELNSKRAILARFQHSVDKGEKLAVGISFDSFQLGPPRANRRGETLYLEDAPVGGKVYPVKSQFTLCSRFSTEITRDLVDGRYECFQDNFGEWVCATASGYRIISTKYEK